MSHRSPTLIPLAMLFCLALACDSDDDGGSDSAGDGNATNASGSTAAGATEDAGDAGTAANGDARCVSGCAATLAANCDNGPADAAQCESDCQRLLGGTCGAAYEALLACSDGAAVTCDTQGLPAVEACAEQQAAFVACLGG